MKKLTTVLILSIVTSSTFGEEHVNGDDNIIKLSFGETRVINRPSTVVCPSSPTDKVCVLKQKFRGDYNYDKETVLVVSGFTSVAGVHGQIPIEKTIELGSFSTRKEASTRMKELQKSGYCL